MEDRRGPGENEHNKSDDASESRKKRAGRLFSELGRDDREQKKSDNYESDDDEEESEDDPKHAREYHRDERQESASDHDNESRWENMMKALFERPEEDESKTSEFESTLHEPEEPGESEFKFSDMSLLRPKNTEQARDDSIEEDAVAEELDEVADELPLVDADYTPDNDEILADDQDDESEEDDGSATSVVSSGQASNGGSAGGAAGGGVRGQGGGGGGGGGVVPTPNFHNNANAPNPATPNQLQNNPNTNNHDPRLRRAIAGLLLVDAIDYLTTKRRENKIKKKNEAVHKQIAEVQEKQQTAHETLAEQTRKLEQARNESEEKQKRFAEELLSKKQEKLVNTNIPKLPAEVLRIVKEVSEITEKTQDKILETQDRELLSTLSERDREILKAEVLERPADVLEAVKRAAEKDAAIETLYEKRHEARGNEGVAQHITTVADEDGRPHLDTRPTSVSWSQPQPLSREVQVPNVVEDKKPKTSFEQQVTRTVTTALIILVFVVVFAVILFI